MCLDLQFLFFKDFSDAHSTFDTVNLRRLHKGYYHCQEHGELNVNFLPLEE